ALGDVISIDWNGATSGLLFSKEAEGALIPMPLPDSAAVAAAAGTSSSRAVPSPKTFAAAEREPIRPTR
ncbi:MAG: hypothetical protein ACRD5K_13825, partial [Candidatus Acidiferrales bacterium]